MFSSVQVSELIECKNSGRVDITSNRTDE